MIFFIVLKLFRIPGGTQQMFLLGRLRPKSNPLPFYMAIFHEKGTPFVYRLLTNAAPLTHLVIKIPHSGGAIIASTPRFRIC